MPGEQTREGQDEYGQSIAAVLLWLLMMVAISELELRTVS
jgi:hypothetical protein